MQYHCEKCKYNTNLTYCYDRHIQSNKHKSREITQVECRDYKCRKCNKILLSKTSLWRHNKTCTETSSTPENTIVSTDMLTRIMNEQAIMKQLIIELSKNQQPTIINNDNSTDNSTTINNTNFNLGVFLNEQCKDAVNISDFIKDMIIDTKTMEMIQNIGYVDGVSKCIVDNLEKYTKFTRPIHYINDTETESNTIHIRDHNKWKEEVEEKKPIMRKTIYKIDEKIYDEFRVYQARTLDEQLVLKKILLKGAYTHYQDSISDQILNNVKMEV